MGGRGGHAGVGTQKARVVTHGAEGQRQGRRVMAGYQSAQIKTRRLATALQ